MTTNEIKSNQHKLCDASAHYLFVSKRRAGKGDMTNSVIASECAQCCVEASQICANLLKNGEQATKWEEQFILPAEKTPCFSCGDESAQSGVTL